MNATAGALRKTSTLSATMWEAENNMFGKGARLDEFKAAYDSLTDEQKNLIYYAYEA